MLRVLYIAYWGALEPLGQSLVVPAAVKLAQMGIELTLVTFEKPGDLAKRDEMERVRRTLSENRIEWHPLKYHQTPKIPATVFDIAGGISKSILKHIRQRFDIVHARTYIGGIVGLLLAPLIGAKYVYHSEGFYPDEQVDSGMWQINSRPHRFARRLDQRMYSGADGIIALSHRAKSEIENLPHVSRKKTPVIVVPSCVDLDRFKLPEKKRVWDGEAIKFVYVGSVGGRYILDRIGSFISAANRLNDKVRLQIYSKSDGELVKSLLDQGGLSEDVWNLESIAYSEMPERLAQQQVGLSFLKQGISEHSGSPTKIGEYWAVGLPILTTPNISDTDDIVRRENVGVIVERHTEEAYLRAFDKLQKLLRDPQLSLRCRQAAEKYYSLVPSCERQVALYSEVMSVPRKK